jgi:hypothetical protein
MVGATDTAEGFAQEREWARDCWTALAPHHAGVFVNWLMDEGEERVRQAYGNKRYERLRAVKRHYDPDNVFRLNQNVPRTDHERATGHGVAAASQTNWVETPRRRDSGATPQASRRVPG